MHIPKNTTSTTGTNTADALSTPTNPLSNITKWCYAVAKEALY